MELFFKWIKLRIKAFCRLDLGVTTLWLHNSKILVLRWMSMSDQLGVSGIEFFLGGPRRISAVRYSEQQSLNIGAATGC